MTLKNVCENLFGLYNSTPGVELLVIQLEYIENTLLLGGFAMSSYI